MSGYEFAFSKSALTRFSHDMAGVISAVSNSLSSLSEDTGGVDEEMLKLALDNAGILVGRLRFFRAAFGNEGPLTNMAETRKILEEYLHTLENRSVCFKCSWQTDAEVPIFVFRLILLAGQLTAECLIRGGEIAIKALAGAKEVVVEAKGKTVILDAGIREVFDGVAGQSVSPKTVPAVFLQNCLEEQGWSLSYAVRNESISLRLAEKC